jgi:RecA-family ATPase
MTAVAKIRPELARIVCPAPLRDLQAWLTWRYEHVDGEPKPRKVPYYTGGGKRSGTQGRPEDRAQLTSFEGARAAAIRRGFDGVGFCPMPEWEITALDFDNCVREGLVDPHVAQLIAGTYAELSPSGEGVRAFVRGSLGNRKDHGEPFGFETFNSKGYVTLTGNRLPSAPADELATATPQILRLCEQRFGRAHDVQQPPREIAPLGLSEAQLQQALDVLDPSMGHDPWLRVGMALHHETSGEGFELWDAWSARGVQYPGRDVLEKRWASFGNGGQRPVTAHALLRLANEAGAHFDLAALEASDHFGVIDAQPAAEKGKPRTWAAPAPIDVDEWTSAQLSPPCIVDGYLYADVALLIAPGGTGKTTLLLYEAVHIVLGMPLWGRAVRKPGPVLVLTGEDSREVLVARLREIAQHLGIEGAQLQQVMRDVLISDLSGGGWKLSQIRNDVVMPSDFADQIVRAVKDRPPVLVTIDPAVSFGVGEARVNDAEQGLVDAARRIRAGLQCCVRFVHHTGKQVALDRREDQYAGRGGSAFADGARMVAVMHSYRGRDMGEAKTWTKRTRTTLAADETGIQLTLAKLSYAAPQAPIFVKRRGPAEFRLVEIEDVLDTPQVENDRAQQLVLDRVGADGQKGLRHTRATLDAVANELELSRTALRGAITILVARGALEEADIDPPPARGARKYLQIAGGALA